MTGMKQSKCDDEQERRKQADETDAKKTRATGGGTATGNDIRCTQQQSKGEDEKSRNET